MPLFDTYSTGLANSMLLTGSTYAGMIDPSPYMRQQSYLAALEKSKSRYKPSKIEGLKEFSLPTKYIENDLNMFLTQRKERMDRLFNKIKFAKENNMPMDFSSDPEVISDKMEDDLQIKQVEKEAEELKTFETKAETNKVMNDVHDIDYKSGIVNTHKDVIENRRSPGMEFYSSRFGPLIPSQKSFESVDEDINKAFNSAKAMTIHGSTDPKLKPIFFSSPEMEGMEKKLKEVWVKTETGDYQTNIESVGKIAQDIISTMSLDIQNALYSQFILQNQGKLFSKDNKKTINDSGVGFDENKIKKIFYEEWIPDYFTKKAERFSFSEVPGKKVSSFAELTIGEDDGGKGTSKGSAKGTNELKEITGEPFEQNITIPSAPGESRYRQIAIYDYTSKPEGNTLSSQLDNMVGKPLSEIKFMGDVYMPGSNIINLNATVPYAKDMKIEQIAYITKAESITENKKGFKGDKKLLPAVGLLVSIDADKAEQLEDYIDIRRGKMSEGERKNEYLINNDQHFKNLAQLAKTNAKVASDVVNGKSTGDLKKDNKILELAKALKIRPYSQYTFSYEKTRITDTDIPFFWHDELIPELKKDDISKRYVKSKDDNRIYFIVRKLLTQDYYSQMEELEKSEFDKSKILIPPTPPPVNIK